MTGKSGISWPAQELTSDPIAKFFQPGSKLSWHWNWAKDWSSSVLPQTSPDLKFNAEFVPMIWSPAQLHEVQQDPDGRDVLGSWKMLFGFNEPDLQGHNVASYRTPVEAAEAWIQLADLRTSPDQKLVSPAIAYDFDWLKEFFSLIPDHTRPEYLAVHVYTTTFEAFKQIVEQYWETFKMPIVLTEFAFQRGSVYSFDPNVPPATSQQQVHDFMGQTTKWLDETPWIIRYSWFGAVRKSENLHGVHEFNRLMDENGEVTPLGWQYINGVVLFTNEPDLNTASGVSTYITPSDAAAVWKTQITKIRALNPSAKVYSPAVAYDTAWLDSFFAAICPGESASNAWGDCAYKPDYLSIHVYSTDAADFKTQVTKYHTTYGLPIVIAEFACYNFDTKTSPSVSDASAFMTATTKWLEEDTQSWVIQYAWFGAARNSKNLYGVAESNRLMDASGALTALGKQYMASGTA